MSFLTKRIESKIEEFKESAILFSEQEIANYKSSLKLEADKEILREAQATIDAIKQSARDIMENEHEYHSAMEEKNTELAKLDAQIDYKKQLLNSMVDTYEIKLQAIKNAHEVVIKAKDEVIKLLTDQVEILTAKLIEIKITDAHINIDCDSLLKERERKEK